MSCSDCTYGDGSGSGYGSGYGDGSGDGYGYGSGDGSSDGPGEGDGDGDEENAQRYFGLLLQSFEPQNAERICFWNSTADGRPANGGSANPVSVGEVQRMAGPLKLCGPHALHGTMRPTAWRGERTWVVALREPVMEMEDKLGSLERRIVADL